MTAARIVEDDQASETFWLPPEHAAMLTTPTGVAPLAVTTTILGRHVPQIAQAFREGGGVPYAAFGPERHRTRPERAGARVHRNRRLGASPADGHGECRERRSKSRLGSRSRIIRNLIALTCGFADLDGESAH